MVIGGAENGLEHFAFKTGRLQVHRTADLLSELHKAEALCRLLITGGLS
jgi:hypothetical protein